MNLVLNAADRIKYICIKEFLNYRNSKVGISKDIGIGTIDKAFFIIPTFICKSGTPKIRLVRSISDFILATKGTCLLQGKAVGIQKSPRARL